MFQTYADLPAPVNTRITKLAFRNRFTSAEKAKIEMAAIDNPSASAQDRLASAGVRATLADQRDAEYIDLSREDTRQGVVDLETYGILSAGRTLEILDTPVSDVEVHKG